MIYLSVNKPLNGEQVQQGYFSYQIKEGDKIINEVSAFLKDFVDTCCGNDNSHSFYYFNRNNAQGPYVSFGGTNTPITIAVYLRNMKHTEAKAYIQIKFGGYK